MPSLEGLSADVLNHLSFLLLFAANAAKDRRRLHLLAAASLALGIVFMHLQGIGSSVWWLSVLYAQNLLQMVRHPDRRRGAEGAEGAKG